MSTDLARPRNRLKKARKLNMTPSTLKLTCTGNLKDGTVILRPRYSAENAHLFDGPRGQIVLHILNPEALARFEPGKEYYIDFSEATE